MYKKGDKVVFIGPKQLFCHPPVGTIGIVAEDQSREDSIDVYIKWNEEVSDSDSWFCEVDRIELVEARKECKCGFTEKDYHLIKIKGNEIIIEDVRKISYCPFCGGIL